MEKIPVSAIVPCFNSEKTILRSLNSIKEQTYLVQEIICIDDCSTDNTVKIIEEFIDENPQIPIILFKNQSNKGPSFSRNRGWDAAKGDYVAFLDADDAWHPEKLAIQYFWMLDNPNIALCGHAYALISSKNSCDSLEINSNFKTYLFRKDELLFSNPFVTPSVMLKTNLSYRFAPDKRYCEDYFLWMQICLDDCQVGMIDVPLTYIFKSYGKSGLTKNTLQMKAGDVHNYWQLWKLNKISFIKMFTLVAYSLLKLIPLLVLGSEYYSELKTNLIMRRFKLVTDPQKSLSK